MLVQYLVVEHDGKICGVPFEIDCSPELDLNSFNIRVVASDPDLEGIHPKRISIYRKAANTLDLDMDDLATAISQSDFSKGQVNPVKTVSEVASGNELLILKKPTPKHVSLKRPRAHSASNDEHERLQRTRLARGPPSTIAKWPQYSSIQRDPKQKIFDDRPELDAQIAPIALLYPPFGEFEDMCANGTDDKHAIDQYKIEKNLNILATEMSRLYADEHERRDAALPILNSIFKFVLRADEVGEAQSHGHAEVDGMISTIAQFENSLPSTNTFPHVQCVGYVAHSHVRADRVKDLCNHRTLPSLAMTFIDDLVQFYAIILLGHQYRAVGLTAPFSFSLSATNSAHKKQLLRAFIAANILQRRIHEDLESWVACESDQVQSSPLPGRFFLPSVTKIRAYGGVGKNTNCINFKIISAAVHTSDADFPDRHLYLGQLTQAVDGYDSPDVLVKFSQTYSIDLHDFCYQERHAPMVLGYERLPGGWFAIAMEHLANAKSINTGLTSDQRVELEGLVTKFHEQGLVHGDLRSANILYNNDNFWLIDFDWGGQAGKVEYPTSLLHEELLSGRESEDLVIHKHDDLRILRATLRNLLSE